MKWCTAFGERGFVALAVMMLAVLLQVRSAPANVQSQLDELVTAAQGKRIGLITNPSGCYENGTPDLDFLLQAPGTTITAFFAPEHGIRGTLPPGVSSGDYIDPDTSIPVYAVYGTRNAPTDAQLANVDLLVFDMQDVGARFYTFVWTMTYCMESAARNGKPFYVVDRPNPIGGLSVGGAPNPSESGLVGRLISGTGLGVSTRHGMTAGEIAYLWNETSMAPKVDLHVIKCLGWTRDQQWDQLGRVFVPPSPNMRSYAAASVYPGTCIFESSNFSVGRGTTAPFEMLGAPYVNATTFADRLTSLSLPGVQFLPSTFTPTSSVYSGQVCKGVVVVVTDRDVFQPIRTGMYMMKEAYVAYPAQFTINSYASTLMGVPNLHNRIKTEAVDALIAEWQPNLGVFRALRSQYLLYPATSAVADWKSY
ncbi:MAG: DUF1343 domain-containing protein [Candidatus Sumerlaeaceae bacterium]|nr:DUF1343 domain-containing protein [Candidatus Sumerlaeaceae bacterium]